MIRGILALLLAGSFGLAASNVSAQEQDCRDEERALNRAESALTRANNTVTKNQQKLDREQDKIESINASYERKIDRIQERRNQMNNQIVTLGLNCLFGHCPTNIAHAIGRLRARIPQLGAQEGSVRQQQNLAINRQHGKIERAQRNLDNSITQRTAKQVERDNAHNALLACQQGG